MRVFATVLLAVSSAFAYQVTSPSNTSGWSTSGTNVVKWNRVDTDPTTFAAFLINQGIGYSELLDSQVDGTTGSLTVSAPSGGWVTGDHFRVNFAQDSTHPDSLLAQSNEFTISGDGSSSSSSSSSGSSSSTSTTSSASPASSRSATSTSSGASSTSSNTSTTPTSTSAGSLAADARAGLITVVAAALSAIMIF